jgi:hypothetical protein
LVKRNEIQKINETTQLHGNKKYILYISVAHHVNETLTPRIKEIIEKM